MQKKIILIQGYLITLILILISITSAETIYSGSTVEIPLDFEIVNCSVINSTYNLEGLNLSWFEKNIIISTVLNYQPDNLTISCWVIKYEEVVEEHHGGGGGSYCIYNKGFDWNCSEWNECTNGEQTRTCKKYNNCYNTYGKPEESRTCQNVGGGGILNKTDDNQGPIQEENHYWKWIVLSFFLAFLLLLLILVIFKKFLRKKKGPSTHAT